MKQGSLNFVIIFGALVLGFLIYEYMLPQFIKDGGYLVAGLVGLSIMVVTFVVERLLSLKKAGGKGPLPKYLKTLVTNLNSNDIAAAIAACDAQRGSLANIVKTGLERYQELMTKKDINKKEKMEEVKRVIEEATMLEMPILEKNLISLSTIASISTMVGLLGTVLGMIRSFAALAKAGATDAAALSLGISEALINTAGGIAIAIVAIVSYNYFTTKIDGMTYMIDEASKDILMNLQSKHE
ncbi:MAG: MotA/TolQ/ExbB proton channel family protein [Bacteriovoracaceae bacterium]|nr:MotA/TolQ/ExbB proton channel family protein [Bacteroidota bacterium]